MDIRQYIQEKSHDKALEPHKLLDFSVENGWVGTENTRFQHFA